MHGSPQHSSIGDGPDPLYDESDSKAVLHGKLRFVDRLSHQTGDMATSFSIRATSFGAIPPTNRAALLPA